MNKPNTIIVEQDRSDFLTRASLDAMKLGLSEEEAQAVRHTEEGIQRNNIQIRVINGRVQIYDALKELLGTTIVILDKDKRREDDPLLFSETITAQPGVSAILLCSEYSPGVTNEDVLKHNDALHNATRNPKGATEEENAILAQGIGQPEWIDAGNACIIYVRKHEITRSPTLRQLKEHLMETTPKE